uniref:Uncharacterized protein n=1 Tax=Zea mays TaxID=4577 RepID=A0A804N110_MAIZE
MAEQDGDAGQRPPDSVPEFVRVEIPNTLIRSGTFLGANEDSTRTLAEIEKKIARATVYWNAIPYVASFLIYLMDVEEGEKLCSHMRSPILQLKIILAVEPLTPSEGPRIGENIFGYTIVDIFSSSCRGHHKNPPSEPYVLERS